MRSVVLWCAVLASAVGCSRAGSTDDQGRVVSPDIESYEKIPRWAPRVRSLELIERLATPEWVNPTGVAVSPAGEIWISASDGGVWRLQGTTWVGVPTRQALLAVPQLTDTQPLWDLAFRGEELALIVPHDGLLYNPTNERARQHFCYEPEGDSGWNFSERWQESGAVAWGATGDVLYAAPVTVDDRFVYASAIATYDGQGGNLTGWHDLGDPSFRVEAMLPLRDGQLLLAHGDTLYQYEARGTPEGVIGKSLGDVGRIDGLAIRPDGALLVLDGAKRQISAYTGWQEALK